MKDKKLTLEDWLDIAEQVFVEFQNRFSDDGKISVMDGLSLLVVLIKAINSRSSN